MSNDKACKEDSLLVHGVQWDPPSGCVDGGIFRPKTTYTNLETSGFKTSIGYSGHFYGIRKYDGLIPNAPYSVVIEGITGNTGGIQVPREFNEIEYGSNNFVNYSGYALLNSGVKFAKSIDVKNNVLAVGSPLEDLNYFEYSSSGTLDAYTLTEAGSVYLYQRQDRPSGSTWPEDQHKSAWQLDSIVTLPSGYLKDYYSSQYTNKIGGVNLPLPIEKRYWKLGQEGRNFGHSVALAVSNSGSPSIGETDKKILVVGAPNARWENRNFEELSSSGVQIGLLIFTDEFVPEIPKRINNYTYYKTYNDVAIALSNKDLIFQYFSNPPVKFDTKIIILEPLADFSNRQIQDFSAPKPTFIKKHTIARNQGLISEQRTETILSGIKSAFHESFPYDTSKLHNNIPVILGISIDDSSSLGREAIAPAIDRFIAYYKEYSFASGLRDFYGVPSSGQCIEYNEISEDWIDNSSALLDYVLDTGRLLAENQVRFFTSGVGLESFNENLSQFNYPPPSGGSVFIFEKESGSWNYIQEIESPNIIYDTPDRFGHAVAISDNAEVIVVGSPYISQSCQVFEHRLEEKNRLYSSLHHWLYNKSAATSGNNIRYTSLIDSHAQWTSQFSMIEANKMLYCALTHTEKFEARKFLNISEYQLSFTYGGDEIILTGGKEPKSGATEWDFIIDTFAPSRRVGYSVAVNEDGSIVAVGSPTDSFNKGSDARVYYKNLGYSEGSLSTSLISSSWASTVNAGSVSILESRKYYPHNSVVEYGKFGNLQENLGNPLDSGHFGYLSSIFRDKNFRKTEFTDPNIPEDAGLAFIITPAVDALSEEVLDNISNWLALGDRNLVLVGNDPSWEENGAYAESNVIINKILKHIKSRMVLVPARNSFEALCDTNICGKAIPSYVPSNFTSTYVTPRQMNAYGVADIRMNLENKLFMAQMPCEDDDGKDTFSSIIAESFDKTPANSKCELPLRHLGDLRAEWKQKCLTPDLKTKLFPVNWATLFKTFKPDCFVASSPSYGDFPKDRKSVV